MNSDLHVCSVEGVLLSCDWSLRGTCVSGRLLSRPPLTFPAAQQTDSAEAQVTRSADGSFVSAVSRVPSSTKLFPTKNTNHSIHLKVYN